MSYDGVSMVSTCLEALELDSTLAGTDIPHTPEKANQVYGEYDFSRSYDDKLPISKFREQVPLYNRILGFFGIGW